MVVDVILAVTVIAAAAGAVPEFQRRIGDIRSAADRTAVVICFLGLRLDTRGTEGDRAVCGLRLPGTPVPEKREQIPDILSREDQIIRQRYKREKIVREEKIGVTHIKDFDQDQYQVNNTHDPRLYRNDKQDHEPAVGIRGRKGQQKT